MNEQHKYRSTDKMSDLICDNYSLFMVMSRLPYIPRRIQLNQRLTILLQRQ